MPRLTRAPQAEPIDAGRLTLEPLRVGHAGELAVVLADPGLYGFTGGTPPSEADLVRRYTAQTVGLSPDGRQAWLNWIVRDTGTGAALGYVQATVEDGTADVAWVIGTAHQGRGVARTAATAMVEWLRRRGVTGVVAHVHPDHLASAAVAARLGLRVTDRLVDGEVEWRDSVRSEG